MTGHTCDSCSFNGTLLEVVQHNRKVHVSDKTDATSCCICGGRVLSCNLRRHIRNCHPDDCAVRCYICSEPFVEDKDMRNHVRCGCLKHPGKARSSFIIGEKKKSKKRGQASTASAASIPANFNSFMDHCRPDDVNKYISKHLQTDAAYRSECSDVVDRVDTFFEDCEGFTLDRFIQGGSIGKGTVIKSKSDIDCVMFTSNLPPIDSPGYNRQLKFYLKWVEDKLKESRLSIAYNLEVLKRTSHAVKLKVKTKKKGHKSHDVDLLLATDLLGNYPTREQKEKVYAMMGRMSRSSRENCSAALVELQRDFVKYQSAEVKNLILLVKMWKKSSVAVTTLKSYQLELLCIHVWNSLPMYSRNVATAFEAVLRKLSDYNSICACWTDNYSMDQVPRDIAIARPLILDPANPYNNVADVCKNWPEVAAAAKRTLQKPFFK